MALNSVGGAWWKEGENGEFLSLSIDDGKDGRVYFLAFANENKEGKQPDFIIYQTVDDDDEGGKPAPKRGGSGNRGSGGSGKGSGGFKSGKRGGRKPSSGGRRGGGTFG